MDESRNISLTIAGKTYTMKAPSQEGERFMRLAAEEINNKLADYGSRFDQTQNDDKLAFVALNETYGKLYYMSKLSSLTKEIEALHEQLDSYIGKALEK